MKTFMFVIDGHGIESWFPVDEKPEYDGSSNGLWFYQMRARLNWGRGCYYMEADLTKDQEETLKQLLHEKKDWLAGKELIETLTGRNFETETGYDSPFDPDWKPDFSSPKAIAKKKMWLKRAGLDDPC